jgi:hypothetical protein
LKLLTFLDVRSSAPANTSCFVAFRYNLGWVRPQQLPCLRAASHPLQVSPPRVQCLPLDPSWALLLLEYLPAGLHDMGNAQSHGEPHNRLAKPKTNRNSPAVFTEDDRNVDAPASLSSRYANLSARDRQQIRSQLLSPVQTDFEHRASLDEEKSLEELDVQRRLSSRTNSASGFRHKAGSTARLSSLPTSKVSLVQSSQTVDIETAISILQEVQKNATPEDIAALRELESETLLRSEC